LTAYDAGSIQRSALHFGKTADCKRIGIAASVLVWKYFQALTASQLVAQDQFSDQRYVSLNSVLSKK